MSSINSFLEYEVLNRNLIQYTRWNIIDILLTIWYILIIIYTQKIYEKVHRPIKCF